MKTNERKDPEKELAVKFRALAHPARVKLVKDLMEKDCCVGEIQKCLSISQPNVSQHLKVLKQAGIIEGKREKTRICYRIADEAMKKAITLLIGEK
jgi:ArsR family transcriptional regulator